MGINKKGQQDWYVLCETTPMTWDHITYKSPTHCDERVSATHYALPLNIILTGATTQDHERKFAMWDIPDGRC